MKTNELQLYGDKTRAEWDRFWVRIAGGLEAYQPDLRYKVGLYRVLLNGVVMAIGTGTDKGGGLAKRLSDFIRASWSGRNHYVGRLIYENRHRLTVEVLIVGSDKEAREIARALKKPMVHHHRPEWTIPSLRAQKVKARVKVRAKPRKPTRPYLGVVPDLKLSDIQPLSG
ncbi:hypothetical protein [Brevundimonas sp. Leaf363]|uniref:hypothetical protein n=1 Tax=Brevundimonas sp. Leaf363 TaxID=1736353 RepID=UPI000A43127A|nr:hypothetical protein [Brevundimonas sp. Leaf363]